MHGGARSDCHSYSSRQRGIPSDDNKGMEASAEIYDARALEQRFQTRRRRHPLRRGWRTRRWLHVAMTGTADQGIPFLGSSLEARGGRSILRRRRCMIRRSIPFGVCESAARCGLGEVPLPVKTTPTSVMADGGNVFASFHLVGGIIAAVLVFPPTLLWGNPRSRSHGSDDGGVWHRSPSWGHHLFRACASQRVPEVQWCGLPSRSRRVSTVRCSQVSLMGS